LNQRNNTRSAFALDAELRRANLRGPRHVHGRGDYPGKRASRGAHKRELFFRSVAVRLDCFAVPPLQRVERGDLNRVER
jgi:hypothetical protein